ncbi:retrovirus-related pol polyprotein LINE-1 [Tanacetum coccineum]
MILLRRVLYVSSVHGFPVSLVDGAKHLVFSKSFSSEVNSNENGGGLYLVPEQQCCCCNSPDCHGCALQSFKEALRKMGRNKAVGPDEIPIEAWRCLGGEGVRWLTTLFNKTFLRAKMQGELRTQRGSAISPYLFAWILDELTKGIQESVPWCLIIADDIVLVLETPQGLNGRLEQWRKALEDKGLRVNREKTEYMRCNFNRNDNDQNEEIRIVGWLTWRATTEILWDKKVPLKLKGKIYRVAIRPAMLYGSECWPLTKVQANRMEVAEMRMLRWTCAEPTGSFLQADRSS